MSVGLKSPASRAHHKQTKNPTTNASLNPQANRKAAQTKQQNPIRSAIYDL